MAQENKKMPIGCMAAMFYSLDALLIIGGLYYLPWGVILILIGVTGVWTTHKNINAEKQKRQQKLDELQAKKQELQIIRDNTNEELASKTLAVIEHDEPIASLDSDYANLTPLQREHTLNKAFEEIVKKGTEDGIITNESETGIKNFIEHFGIPVEKFEKHDWYSQYQKLLVIKDLLNGQIPQRCEVATEGFFLNLAKNEQLIWRFDNVTFLEEVQKTHYEGGSSSISIRIAKGVYYRTGAVKGRPVTTTSMQEKAVGTLFVATKHLYFYSTNKTIKIPFAKVIAFTPYSDGLGVQKDTATAKPQAFQGLDGWFIYNLVTNVINL